MTLETLLLLRRCLHAQTLTVGDDAFTDVAPQVLRALTELDQEIEAAGEGEVGS